MATHSERGSLPLALAVTILVTGLVSVVMASVVMGQQQTRFDESYERALHLAEAGADRALQAAGGEAEFEADEGPDEDEDPREWAVDQAYDAIGTDEDDPALRELGGGGWAYGILVAGGSEDSDDIYGVGIADRGDRSVERVVRYQISDGTPYQPEHAILADCGDEGELKIHGTGSDDDIIDISGEGKADVHANCDIEGGGPLEIQGNVSSSGDVDVAGAAGEIEENVGEIPVPDISARGYYGRSADYEGNWFDLCPNGKIREPDPGMSPCEGSVVTTVPNNDTDRGWDWDGSDTWTLKGGDAYTEGVYYVYQASAEINTEGNSSAVGTVLVEADESDRDGTGHIETQGNSTMSAFMSDIMLIADGNIKFRGTSGTGTDVPPGAQGCADLSGGGAEINAGLVAANGFVSSSGNVSICGAIMIAGDEDFDGKGPHGGGGGSDVASGNARVFYDPNLEATLGGGSDIVGWQEF